MELDDRLNAGTVTNVNSTTAPWSSLASTTGWPLPARYAVSVGDSSLVRYDLSTGSAVEPVRDGRIARRAG